MGQAAGAAKFRDDFSRRRTFGRRIETDAMSANDFFLGLANGTS